MTPEEIAEFERWMDRVESAYNGEKMVIKAACRAARCDRSAVSGADEAVALLIENGWTWSDVLTANS